MQISILRKYGYTHVKESTSVDTILSIRHQATQDLFRPLGEALQAQTGLTETLLHELESKETGIVSDELLAHLSHFNSSQAQIDIEPDSDLIPLKQAMEKPMAKPPVMNFYKIVHKTPGLIKGATKRH